MLSAPDHTAGSRKARAGLTAVEVLVACALATLLMSTLMGVLGVLAKHQKDFARRYPNPKWADRLQAQIRWDFDNSVRIHRFPDRIRLVGFASRDFQTGEPTSRPTSVTYWVTGDRENRWLARTEIHPDELTNRNVRTDLLCSGVSRIEAHALTMEGVEPESMIKLTPDGSPLPKAIRVVLFNQQNEPSFMRDVILRPQNPNELGTDRK